MPLTDGQRVNFEVVVKGLFAATGGSKPKPTANVLHYKRTAFPATWVPANTLTAFNAACKTAWKAAASASWTYGSVSIRCIDDPIEGVTEVAVNEVGDVAGEPYSNFVAMVISKKSAFRGKSYRGRIYIPGIAESACNGNALTNGQKALLNTLTTALAGTITDGDGNEFKPSIFSLTRTLNEAPKGTVKAVLVTSMVARQQVGSMNSRKAPVMS